jgi:hypothetical protein
MKTVFNLAFLLYGIMVCTPLFAQRRTVPGHYISLQGDTVKGMFLNYSEWSKNPSSVEFAPVGSLKPTMLTPQNCRQFVIEGYDEYVSFLGKRLVNPISDKKVLDKKYRSDADEPEEVATFLRLVTRTPGCQLYAFTDIKRTNFFYRLPGDSLVELRYKKHYFVYYLIDMYDQEVKNIITIPEYRKQLNNLFFETIGKRKLSGILKTLPYTEEKLQMFIEQLFPPELAKQKQKSRSSGWVLSAGASLNFMNVKAANSSSTNSPVSPLLSIAYMVPSSRNFGKQFLSPQLNLFRYKNTVETYDGTFKTVTTYQNDMVILGEVNGGLNVINRQRVRLYLSAGAGMMVIVNNRRLDNKYLNSQPSSEPYRSDETEIAVKATPAFNASTGMLLGNKLLVNFKYLLPTQIGTKDTPRYSALQFTIGYKVN